jgi:hypothetical protein
MNKDLLEYNIILISEQLTTEQIIFSRRNRDWESFDESTYLEKLIIRLEELQYYEDDIDPQYKPKIFNDR